MNPSGNDQHGDAVNAGLADAACSVGNARRRHNQQGAQFGAGAAYCVSHECTTTLMGNKRWLDAFRTVQLVINFSGVHARNTKRAAYAELFQCVANEGSAGFFHGYVLKIIIVNAR